MSGVLLQSPGKINLTLTVTGRRSDGFHDLSTLFFRLPAVEMLTLRPDKVHNVNDMLVVRGAPLPARNTITRSFELLRRKSGRIPPVEVELSKRIPPGSGLGSGSGNAAAILRWGAARYGVPLQPAELASVGADVPFLYSGEGCALATGVGECLQPMPLARPLWVVVLVPRWSSDTAAAFAGIDAARAGRQWGTAEEGERVARSVAEDLERGASVGMLPNDFAGGLLRLHPEYRRFFDLAERRGAPAWGITGSGSSAFALARCAGEAFHLAAAGERFPWVRCCGVV
ncbi:MAG: hypothetical protein K9L28_01575 [Synergistales bacterium]|nr:hypothetical protein [Synergistales bacterium]